MLSVYLTIRIQINIVLLYFLSNARVRSTFFQNYSYELSAHRLFLNGDLLWNKTNTNIKKGKLYTACYNFEYYKI